MSSCSTRGSLALAGLAGYAASADPKPNGGRLLERTNALAPVPCGAGARLAHALHWRRLQQRPADDRGRVAPRRCALPARSAPGGGGAPGIGAQLPHGHLLPKSDRRRFAGMIARCGKYARALRALFGKSLEGEHKAAFEKIINGANVQQRLDGQLVELASGGWTYVKWHKAGARKVPPTAGEVLLLASTVTSGALSPPAPASACCRHWASPRRLGPLPEQHRCPKPHSGCGCVPGLHGAVLNEARHRCHRRARRLECEDGNLYLHWTLGRLKKVRRRQLLVTQLILLRSREA